MMIHIQEKGEYYIDVGIECAFIFCLTKEGIDRARPGREIRSIDLATVHIPIEPGFYTYSQVLNRLRIYWIY